MKQDLVVIFIFFQKKIPRVILAILIFLFSSLRNYSQTLQLTTFPNPSDTIQFDIQYQSDSIKNQTIIYFYIKGTKHYVAKLIEDSYEKHLKKCNPLYTHKIGYSKYHFDSTMNFYDQYNRIYSTNNYVYGIKENSSLFYSYYGTTSNIKKLENFNGNKYSRDVLEYYQNGQLKKSTYYINNKAQGLCISYYENGNIHVIHHHHKGKQTGLYSKYYENGVIERKGFLEKDKGVGEWNYYYSNGQLKENGFEIKNKRYGWWFFYDEDGNFLYPKFYKNNQVKKAPEEIGRQLHKILLKY